jgi:hypothetical protein
MKSGTFDDLTRTLASTTSRRGAFRRIAGILAGGTVGGATLFELSAGVALADGGNSDCADFCNAIFAPGSARGQCKSDAAHGTGLCYTCGPKSSGGSQAICCPTDSNGQCTSYSSATCCGSGQTCQSGTCVVATCTGVVLCNGTCAHPCDPFNPPHACPCGSCYIDNDFQHGYCITGGGSRASCNTDCDCMTGEFCSSAGCLTPC